MGQLIGGEWRSDAEISKSDDGAFKRANAVYRNWVTPDGVAGPSGVGGFAAESERYHLYVSYACPWAHRTLIMRKLKALEDHVSVSVVHPDLLEDGWSFDRSFDGTTGDTLFGLPFLRDIYLRADGQATGRVTVPVLWDKQRNTIVSNESSEIIRMFNSAFDAITGDEHDFWPAAQRDEIEKANERIYHTLNNGVYKCGFARSQAAYDAAVAPLFDTLDWLEARLSERRYLMGDHVTEADWRLFPTLIRFDPVYHGHFKCNRRRIVDYPVLWAYARELFQWSGVRQTVNFDHIRRHYHYSQESINPFRIVPVGPDLDYCAPHRRGASLTAAA